MLGQGHGCDDDYVPDPDRVNCGTHETTEETCHASNCTWCPTEPDTAIPWCYISTVVGTGYVMEGEPILSPDEVTVSLVRSAGGRNRKPRWDGEAETLTLTASFHSNDRLRVKVSLIYVTYDYNLQLQYNTTSTYISF